MKYLMDTNICIYLIKKKPLKVLEKLNQIPLTEVGISAITLSELEYGVEKSSFPEQNRIALLEFLSIFNIYDYNETAALEYGIIRSHLERKGLLIGSLDLLIAAHAKSLNLILVTNNVKEFKRVPALKTENWT